MTSSSTNLPAIVTQTGGALVTVLSDLPAYCDKQLTPVQQAAIGMVVGRDPQLNTEGGVSLLVDLVAYHDEPVDRWLAEQIREHGIKVVHLAIDYLLESGQRDRSSSADNQTASKPDWDLRESTEELIELIEKLADVVDDELTTETLHRAVLRLASQSVHELDKRELTQLVNSRGDLDVAYGYDDEDDIDNDVDANDGEEER